MKPNWGNCKMSGSGDSDPGSPQALVRAQAIVIPEAGGQDVLTLKEKNRSGSGRFRFTIMQVPSTLSTCSLVMVK